MAGTKQTKNMGSKENTIANPFREIYYCEKCKRPQKRYVGKDKHLSKIFKLHIKYSQKYDNYDKFKHDWNKMWRRMVSKRKKEQDLICTYEPCQKNICYSYMEDGSCAINDKKCYYKGIKNE